MTHFIVYICVVFCVYVKLFSIQFSQFLPLVLSFNSRWKSTYQSKNVLNFITVGLTC